MTWGIRYALASAVKEHGELSDEANIWTRLEVDPVIYTEEEAWAMCESEDIDSDNIYVHRPYKEEPS